MVFNVGSDAAIYICSFVLLCLVPSILMVWIYLGKVSNDNFTIWTYITRNTFAFYLGWVIAATNLNLGMDIVYWFGADKKVQLVIFWVIAPLCAIGAFALNYVN